MRLIVDYLGFPDSNALVGVSLYEYRITDLNFRQTMRKVEQGCHKASRSPESW